MEPLLPETFRIIDLSLALDQSLPCTWPGHMTFAHSNWNWYAEVSQATGDTHSFDHYQTNFLVIDEHCGTHFDAPTHFIPPPDSGLPNAGPFGAESGDKVNLAALIGNAVMIDVRDLVKEGKPGISPYITVDFIKGWESMNGPIEPGEIVLFWSGWDRYYLKGKEGLNYVQKPVVLKETPGWPAPEPEAAIYLHEHGVKTIGSDTPSLGAVHNGMPLHVKALGRGLIFIEALTNLGELPVRGAKFMFLPIKVAGSTGSPGRAIALVAEEVNP
jgi:kynurenine formamidase